MLKHFLLISQVGIIMHLPTIVAHERKEITDEFFHYRHLTQAELWDKDSDSKRCAKMEALINILHLIFFSIFNLSRTVPKDRDELAALQARLRKRFPVDAYNKARKNWTPTGSSRTTAGWKICSHLWKQIERHPSAVV
ncbi:hypothetical protein DKX38_009038 [Salix brachista]|uniref:Uncharacterized protein n=1 Tax=Salix brachista TaxID=2182728 RepID=A0A5N5M9R9_9ROSI|nr:hypothetical protein DKX38_009038 [Salix brachista]